MIGKTLRLASICLGFMGGGLSSGVAADLVKIGVLNTSGDIAVHVANEKGYFRQEGIDIEFIVFDASAKMIPSLGVGDLDVGGGATAVSLFNAIDRKVGVRIVADKGRTEPGYVYQSVMIRKELVTSGRFKSWSDLRGLRFAQGGAGGGVCAHRRGGEHV